MIVSYQNQNNQSVIYTEKQIQLYHHFTMKIRHLNLPVTEVQIDNIFYYLS